MSDNYYGPSPALKALAGADIRAGVIDSTKLVAGLAQNITTLSSTQALTTAMTGLVLVNAAGGAVTLTLPAAASGAPLIYRFARTDAVFNNVVTIQRAGSDTIDEPFNITTTAVVLTVDQNTITLLSDGVSVWYIQAGAMASPSTGRKNGFMNGNFDIWQRNTTFTFAATSGYTADRWIASSGTGGSPSVTATRQVHTIGQSGVPSEPSFYLQLQQTALASGVNPTLEQRIENVRTFAGKTVTVSYYAWVGSGTLSVTPSLAQAFGTGGSPSGSVTLNSSAVTVTTTPTKYAFTLTLGSLSGKTIGTNINDYLSFFFAFPVNTTFTFNISQVQIEEGSIATQFERRTAQEELAMCQRYYFKTFPSATVVAQSAGVSGAITWITQVATAWALECCFPVVMRAAPSITTFNPSAANANWRDTTGAADVVVTVVDTSDRRTNLQGAGATAAHTCSIHVTASAEL